MGFRSSVSTKAEAFQSNQAAHEAALALTEAAAEQARTGAGQGARTAPEPGKAVAARAGARLLIQFTLSKSACSPGTGSMTGPAPRRGLSPASAVCPAANA